MHKIAKIKGRESNGIYSTCNRCDITSFIKFFECHKSVLSLLVPLYSILELLVCGLIPLSLHCLKQTEQLTDSYNDAN